MTKHALIGVLGHVDHGKTALVRALTGTETDRLREERERGISIVLGFARLAWPGAELDLVDVPGHERFVRAMVAGATAMRAALLVVDAAEGVRAQTVEHAEIAALLGIRRGVVAVTRADRAAPEEAARAAAEAGSLLRRLDLGDWPVIATSALTGQGLAALSDALQALAEAPAESDPAVAWLPLDRAFSLPGAGTVATGALRRGRLEPGAELEILPGGQRVTIRGLQCHGQAVARAEAGRRVAVALRGVAKEVVVPGRALAAPGLLVAAPRLDVRLRILPSAPRTLARGEVLHLLLGTAEAEARLHLLDRGVIAPGEAAVAQLRLDTLLAAPVREPFVLRLPSPARTVGGGVVLDPDPPRRPARDAARLLAMAAADAGGATLLRLEEAGLHGLPAAAVARLAGVPVAALETRLASLGAIRLATGDVVLHREICARAEAGLLDAVEAAQRCDPTGPGPDIAALRPALPPGAPLEGLVARLVARRALHLAAGRLRRQGLDPAALLSAEDRALLAEVEGAFRRGLLAPPDAETVVGRCRRRAAALHHLLRGGVLVRAPDAVQKREIVFHRDALAAARRAIRTHFAGRPDGFLAGECGRLLGISRRYAIPLLERLDAERFTRRAGDRRHLERIAEGRGRPGA
jgi:selenocysteine-specific elongation factor